MSTNPSPAARYGLAIHTASPDLGLALSNFADDRRSQSWNLGQSLSTHLHTYLADFLQPQTWADLAWIAVARGPGGFTGTRIGVVTARTLAQQLNLPLYAISTLAAVAWSHHQSAPADGADIAVQMRAQRGEVYGAVYSISPHFSPLLPDAVMPLAQWQQTIATWDRPHRLIEAEAGLGNTAPALLELAQQEWQQGIRPTWAEALPFYGQSPV